MFYQKILFIIKNKELRKKFLIVIFLLVVFRLAAHIPIPGIRLEQMKGFFEQNQAFGLLNLFTGGALSNFSLVLLGLGPYITATIILQLLTMIFPGLERLYKEEGEAGRRKFNQYARLLTIPLSIVEGYSMILLFKKQGLILEMPLSLMISTLLTITAGAMFLMWLGELISEQGIGNGISLLIFAGIVARVPLNIFEMAVSFQSSELVSYIIFFVLCIGIIAGVVLINEARRPIPVSFAKRIRGFKMYGGGTSFLPLSINPAGVIPIIFALSVLLFFSMIFNYLATYEGIGAIVAKSMNDFFNNIWVHNALYFLLVVVFTYFYTAVVFDPKVIAENLQKIGGFVKGVRPGLPTATYVKNILHKVIFPGALALGFIAVLPSFVNTLTGIGQFSFLIGGTSVLIIVSVVLETVRQVNSQLQMREYDTF